jgi:predicted ArsR family transcriptional regulator
MTIQSIPDDMMSLLKMIDEYGSTVCVGTCEHRKPGELHCHKISHDLKLSSSGVKRRLRDLFHMGLLNRDRVTREDGKVMARYTLTEQGSKLLN